MPYRELYEHAQTLTVPVSRNSLRDKAIEIAGVPKVAHVRATMDLDVSRGFWLTPTNTDHHLVRQHGSHVIVTGRDLNRCWERIVYVKELMHLFDDEAGKASSVYDFDSLLSEFASPVPTDRSHQMTSEIVALWRALALLCPENQRRQFAAERTELKVGDYEIALRLRIPEYHVPRLFSSTFDSILQTILWDE